MLWINEHKHIWRVSILGLLLVAIFGPWAFDRIVVPAEYPCSAPFIRLEGDFCGSPLSGIWMLWAVASEFTNRVMGVIGGTVSLAELGVGFRVLLFPLLLLLPFTSTLLQLLPGNRRPQQGFNIAVWGVAAGLGLLIGISSHPKLYWALWGIWLYIGVTSCALILEALTLKGRSPRMG